MIDTGTAIGTKSAELFVAIIKRKPVLGQLALHDLKSRRGKPHRYAECATALGLTISAVTTIGYNRIRRNSIADVSALTSTKVMRGLIKRRRNKLAPICSFLRVDLEVRSAAPLSHPDRQCRLRPLQVQMMLDLQMAIQKLS